MDPDPNFSLKKNIRVRNFLITGGCGPDEDEGLEGGGGAAEGASAPLLASSPVQECVIHQARKIFSVYSSFKGDRSYVAGNIKCGLSFKCKVIIEAS